jgi:hypothetical protein
MLCQPPLVGFYCLFHGLCMTKVLQLAYKYRSFMNSYVSGIAWYFIYKNPADFKFG